MRTLPRTAAASAVAIALVLGSGAAAAQAAERRYPEPRGKGVLTKVEPRKESRKAQEKREQTRKNRVGASAFAKAVGEASKVRKAAVEAANAAFRAETAPIVEQFRATLASLEPGTPAYQLAIDDFKLAIAPAVDKLHAAVDAANAAFDAARAAADAQRDTIVDSNKASAAAKAALRAAVKKAASDRRAAVAAARAEFLAAVEDAQDELEAALEEAGEDQELAHEAYLDYQVSTEEARDAFAQAKAIAKGKFKAAVKSAYRTYGKRHGHGAPDGVELPDKHGADDAPEAPEPESEVGGGIQFG